MIIQVGISPKVMRWTEMPPGSDPDTDTVAAADVDGGEVCEGDGCEQAPIIPGTEDPDTFNGDLFDF